MSRNEKQYPERKTILKKIYIYLHKTYEINYLEEQMRSEYICTLENSHYSIQIVIYENINYFPIQFPSGG